MLKLRSILVAAEMKALQSVYFLQKEERSYPLLMVKQTSRERCIQHTLGVYMKYSYLENKQQLATQLCWKSLQNFVNELF